MYVGKMADHIYVINRHGEREPVSFDKILKRINALADGLAHVNPDLVAQKVCSQIADGIKTSELDEFAAETCATMQARHHPNYGKLAARIVIDNHQKNTPATLRECVERLYVEELITPTYANVGRDVRLEALIDYSRDFNFDYFGFRTLENGYLLKGRNGKALERPQHMWMRVALQMYGDVDDSGDLPDSALPRIKETYDALSLGYFIQATPTLFNSGTNHPQLSSCFLLTMDSDSIQGIYKTLGDCAQISKWAGGIGLSVHNIRARDSAIKGTNGKATGLVPMLRVFNDTARYVNQGGKRNGSFAIYLEPWHADIRAFLKLKLNTGAEEERARDLFYGLWIPDLFMKRVEEGGMWTLMCPNECPGLADCWGEEFETLYTRYEREGKGREQVEAKKLWMEILDAQIQTGTPYLCYKDAANRKSNQQNLGTIKSSNLCVAPETTICIRDKEKGDIHPVKISNIENEAVEIWNGTQWSEVIVRKTGYQQKLLRVVVEITQHSNRIAYTHTSREVLYCTPYHKFLLPSENGNIQSCPRVDASQLEPNMILQGYTDDNGNWNYQKVVSVEFDGRFDDTYCFNEPINHAGVFNGILTGNCTEIIEYSSPEETAVCNLGSIALPKFVDTSVSPPVFDFEALRKYTAILTRNLDIVIDKNFYPTPETRRSNMRHRPIGIGVQGLADTFALMRMPWQSEEASQLNREIFENMYYASVRASMERAKELTIGEWHGLELRTGHYSSFPGSPASKGQLQYDLWKELPTRTPYLNWTELKEQVKHYGMRNSLLLAPMPTASTSQILGNNECIEPFTSNLYSRRVLAGDFIVINKYLVEDLLRLGLWTPDIRTQILANNGSIQTITAIPQEIRELYRTSWEIPMKTLINMAADRAPFICQSQSLNLFLAEPTYSKVSSMHFYAWKKGLKTGCYYLRTKAVAKTQQFTVEPPPSATAPQECLTCSA